MTLTRATFVLGSVVAVGAAQTPAAKFEVASVRKSEWPAVGMPLPPCYPGSNSPGRLTMCTSIFSFVSGAYGVYRNGRIDISAIPPMVEGGPDWVRTDWYEINAKAPDVATQEMMRGPMMQALLEDRFKLRMHRELRQVPVYELTVKNEAKLRPHLQGNCTPFERDKPRPEPQQGQPPVCKSASMSSGRGETSVSGDYLPFDTFASGLAGIGGVDRPVLNRTEFTHIFDLNLRFVSLSIPIGAVAQPAADDTGLPSVFTALEEELGLKLEPAKGEQEFLVIDRIERPSAD